MRPIQSVISDRRHAGRGRKKNTVQFFLPAPGQERINVLAKDEVGGVLAAGLDKISLKDSLDQVRADVEESLAENLASEEVTAADIADAMSAVIKEATRSRILNEGVRPDGRATDEIRPIRIQVGKLPRVHGSGLFMRGDTHVLTIATLGTPGDAQRIDTLQPTDDKRYMHHYNFPPYSTGEAYPLRGPRRREIPRRAGGTGAAAHDPGGFPVYAAACQRGSGNGSTSMASVCGSTLALMGAGVPIAAPCPVWPWVW